MTDRSPDMPDAFDRLMEKLTDLPDVVKSRPATVEETDLLGNCITFVVTTLRQKDRGDTVFVRIMDKDGGRRFVIPPKASTAIARQRDSLTAKNRKKGARAAVETRREAGIIPFAKKEAEG